MAARIKLTAAKPRERLTPPTPTWPASSAHALVIMDKGTNAHGRIAVEIHHDGWTAASTLTQPDQVYAWAEQALKARDEERAKVAAVKPQKKGVF